MKTVYMHKLYMGTIGDMKNLEQHFALMAEKGWMIDKIGTITHRYRAVEPCKMSFFVDFLPQITAFDYPENEDAQDYRGMCEASGWTFVAANKQFHVFCSEGGTATPIHTDNAIQAKIHLRASKKYELPFLINALFMMWVFSPFGNGIELFLSNMMLFMTIGYLFFGVGYFWTLGFIIRWYIRTKKSAKLDLPMPVVDYRPAKLRNRVFTAGIVLFLLCMITGIVLELATGLSPYVIFIVALPLLGIFTGLWIRRQIDTKKRTRGANIRLFVIAMAVMELIIIGGMVYMISNMLRVRLYDDSLGERPALTLQDFDITSAPENSSTMIKGSVAVPDNYSYWEVTRGGSVHTEVYRSVSGILSKGLYKKFSEDFVKQYTREMLSTYEVIQLTPADAAVWGAEEGLAVFSGYNMELLLRHEKTILRLSIGIEDLSAEQAGAVVKRVFDW